MGKRAGPVQQQTSPASHDSGSGPEQGFTLLEVVCVVAILAILAGFVFPSLPRTTSRARLESYAIATAALLKADRNAALRRQTEVETEINAEKRLVRSGATGRSLLIPDDVSFDALLSARCNRNFAGSGVTFFPSGMSCGGVIALSRSDNSYEIRVNWLTGGIEVVVPLKPS
jgi:general secretion pathway protein H